MIKLSDYIVSFLKEKEVSHIFMITGGGSMHLNDSIGQEKSIKFICNHHEQASAIAAESYARMTNKIGVCQVTTGPGSTNTLTGLIGGWLDSIPMFIISGQVKTTTSLYKLPPTRQIGIQEINIIDMVKPVTKYAVPILDANEIRYYLEKAWFLAKNGRPGPVWLDVPLDIQSTMINESELRGFDPKEIVQNQDLINIDKQIGETIELIKSAKRPVIVAGFGIRLGSANDFFYKFIDKAKIPVVTSLSAHDLMWESHPLYAGRFGLYGNRGGNFAIQNSDLVIVLGCRMSLWEVGYDYEKFAREAKKVMIDIDRQELEKPTFVPDIMIQCDVKLFLSRIVQKLELDKTPSFSLWLDKCKYWQKKYPVILPEYSKEKKYVNYYYFMGELSKALTKDNVIITGNGTSFTGTCQAIKIKQGQRLGINIGCASMGYDLPAAIGAYFANQKKGIILITGDGSIQMNIQELQTIVHHKIPIKIFLINNNGYLAIRITQSNFFKKQYGIDSNSGISFPDMQKIAKAYGIPSIRINNQKNLKQKLKKVLDTKGPYLCEIMMPPNQELIPKLKTKADAKGRLSLSPLEDMYPFLPRKEFLKNLYIKPL